MAGGVQYVKCHLRLNKESFCYVAIKSILTVVNCKEADQWFNMSFIQQAVQLLSTVECQTVSFEAPCTYKENLHVSKFWKSVATCLLKLHIVYPRSP